jgi:GNAT superfamily N-acetyltransferase
MAERDGQAATIRRAGPGDARALARLRWMWRTVERGELGLSETEFKVAFTQWWRTRQSTHVAYIAEVAGDAVGMAWLAVFDRMPQPRQLERLAGNVQSVFVLEAHRNRGTGRALVDAVINEANARGLGYLIVHPSARAYPLYKRLGFAETNQILHMDLGGHAPTEPPEYLTGWEAPRALAGFPAASGTSDARTARR